MQMARYSSKDNQGYRAICGVLKATIREGMNRGSPAQQVQNKALQPHAAGAAAAYAEVPIAIPPTDVAKTRTAEEVIRSTSKRVITPTYYIPFTKNRYFVGRKAELDALKQKLMVSHECQKMTVVGLGGTGKTQVALQFAYIVKETWPECSILWVPALSFESFEQACVDIARELHIPQEAGGEEDVKELVRQHLSSARAGRWLLVLDNADDSDILFGTAGSGGIVDYLPESEEGVTVYTTRILDVAVSLTRSDVLELGAMNPQDAAHFLEKSLVSKDLRDEAATKELLDELTCLPLAIAQAAAYLNRNRMSIAKYLHLLRNTEQDVVGLMSREFRDDTRYKNSANAVATTWVVSFSQIRAHDAVAADLLAFMSCVEWKAIPRSLLPSVQPEERMEEAIGTLCGYSFLLRREDGEREEEEERYDMHRLVHLAMRVWIGRHGDAAEVAEEATRHVARVFPTNDFASRAVWRAYLPHALRLLGYTQDGNAKEKSKLCLWVGRCLQVDGRILEAVGWLEECCRLRNKLDEEDSDRLFSQHELAIAYQSDGQVEKAVELLEHVVAVREKVLAEEHPSRLASQHVLAIVYKADGQVKKALELLEHVVTVREKALAEEHPDRLTSQHALAWAYEADGQVQKAVELLEHVVAVQEKVLAEEHPDRLASQHELARAYEADGQVQRAVQLLEHVVTLQEKVLAEEHPKRLRSQHALAGTYLAEGQVQKAVELLEYVAAVREKELTEEHPDRLASQHELARAYEADGQVQKAVELLEHVLAVKEKVLAEEHPERLASQHVLAIAYEADGQVKKAVELLEHVVAVKEKVLAEEHPDRLASQHELAMAYQADGQVKKAVELMEHVVAVEATVLRDDHPSRLVSQEALANVMHSYRSADS
ncbi:TPR-like protein [Periconia macrospinosa]|uniref:TPR-like protein n=1 Tax=Periconia macrospinosa TaxID=97972 RepID=A0A2V1D6J2_9PLEO|nr:TPR-like protein [Periconia macrospinosa]